MEIKERNLSSGFCTFIDICRSFDFLKSEGYITSKFFTGRDVYVVYKNPKINQTITISLPEPNEKTFMRWKWQIVINKKVFLFTKTISITDCLELPANLNLTEQLIAYSQFIRENIMTIVRGEKWNQIDRCKWHKNTCSLISYSDFIQQNLMPVIRGNSGFLDFWNSGELY